MTAKQLEQYFRQLIREKGDRALPSISIFLSHEKAPFRQKAVQALGGLPLKQTKDLIFPLIEDSSMSVRKEVINALVRSGDESVGAILDAIAQSSSDEKLLSHIEIARKRLGQVQAGVLSVSGYIDMTNTLLGQDEVQVEGEISSYQVSSYGANQWVFFDLKDEKKESKIRCFTTLFAIRSSRISPMDGMRVIVTGKSRISVKSGIFSLNVSRMELSGEGELLKSFEMLKQQLNQEGLFQTSRKRALPEFPQTIGLITSQDAAAYKDFMKVLTGRMGGLDIRFHHAQVQGERAVTSIIQAIENLASYPEVEVIVLTRGGGSMDDLHAFNDEAVARAIFGCHKPVLSAVGHERDETIADYVADMRASTPSNAAELLVPHRQDMLRQIESREGQLTSQVESILYRQRTTVDGIVFRMERTIRDIQSQVESRIQRVRELERTIAFRIERERLQVDQIPEQLFQRVRAQIQTTGQEIEHKQRYIGSFDPQPILRRGYSIVRFEGNVVQDSALPQSGDRLEIETSNHRIHSIVTEVKK